MRWSSWRNEKVRRKGVSGRGHLIPVFFAIRVLNLAARFPGAGCGHVFRAFDAPALLTPDRDIHEFDTGLNGNREDCDNFTHVRGSERVR